MSGLSCGLDAEPAVNDGRVGETEGGESDLRGRVDELEVGQAGSSEMLLGRGVNSFEGFQRGVRRLV